MSLHYMLNEDNYEGNREDIGSIMLKFVQQLYRETGLSLNQYAGLTSEEINKYFKHNNMEVLLEKVMWKNMTQREKVETMCSYLKEIDAENGDLIIIDPYLFPRRFNSEYTYLMIEILNGVKLKSIQFITSKKTYNEKLYNDIKNMCDCKNIRLKFTDDYHDRFWIANKSKGFIMGTSLNGLGSRISLIDFINKDDLKDIVSDFDSKHFQQ